jgi:hypothetical protein
MRKTGDFQATDERIGKTGVVAFLGQLQSNPAPKRDGKRARFSSSALGILPH